MMIVRKRRRIEVRLDEARGEFLDRALARRLAAVERLVSLNLDVPDDPAELKRLLVKDDGFDDEFWDCQNPVQLR